MLVDTFRLYWYSSFASIINECVFTVQHLLGVPPVKGLARSQVMQFAHLRNNVFAHGTVTIIFNS